MARCNRFWLGGALSILVLAPNHGVAAQAPDYAAAYQHAIKCFVAGAASLPTASEDPTGDKTAAINAKTRFAFDAAYAMGGKLGHSEARISDDLDQAQAVEMRLMVQNAEYFARVKADCVKLGLM